MPQRENTQSAIFFSQFRSSFGFKKITPGKSNFELQWVMNDRMLPTAITKEPKRTRREVKVPTSFRQYFTHSSVINEEKEPLLYKQAFKSSSVEKWLDPMQEGIQNLKENQTLSSVEALYGNKLYLEMDINN